MYGGIVHDTYPVVELDRKTGLTTLTLELADELLPGLAIGASVGVSGVCLTVTRLDGARASFDVMGQTLDVTTLGALDAGDRVNVERSLKQGDEVGGHPISGHIDGVAEIVEVLRPENNCVVTLRLPDKCLPYVFERGFLALDGCSLTVATLDREARTATVHLIPETLQRTTFGTKGVGDLVNVEVDRNTQVIVDTVVRVLGEMAREGGGAAAGLAGLSSWGTRE